MNTPIINYLVGMGMVATLALIPKKIYWLYGKDKKEKVKILPYIAASLPAIYTIFYEVYLQLYGKPNLNLNVFLNFLQHSIGGGVAVGLICYYLYQNFKFRLPWLKDWRIKLIFLVGIISIFGVANEVVELILDLLNFSQYSRDRFDTWIDLVANTSGALVSFYASLKFNKKASL
jgi:hypothetical protein